MGKPENILPSDELRIASNPVIREYLRRLVLTGFYGKNPTEAAEKLLAGTIETMVESGKLTSITTDELRQLLEGQKV